MRKLLAIASATALGLGLAACDSPAEEAAEDDAVLVEDDAMMADDTMMMEAEDPMMMETEDPMMTEDDAVLDDDAVVVE